MVINYTKQYVSGYYEIEKIQLFYLKINKKLQRKSIFPF